MKQRLVEQLSNIKVPNNEILKGMIAIPVAQQMVEDHLSKQNNLWLFTSTEQSKIQVEMPILLRNMRSIGQLAMYTFIHQSEYKIEATGLLCWKGNKIVCDPIALRLYYPDPEAVRSNR